ncbi:MAG: RluA family pseudouridine synthase [Idiomarina sp.]|nr:RluA family pseudouridine synthase [Idiomarina sp.]
MHNQRLQEHIIDDFIAPACDGFVDILFQDDAILLINKPSGLLSLSGKNPRNLDSVHYRLVNGQPGVSAPFCQAKLPHRLDFGTSGVMVVALNQQATQQLNHQFQAGTVQKRYVAVVEGWVTDDEGVINAPIAKDKTQFPRVKVCEATGKAATSHFRVLERLTQPQRTLVEFTPMTGRTHQLRIHSLFMGHPILGCDLYHNATSQQLAERLQLHASDLYFQHPLTGEPVHGHCTSPF